MLFISLVGCIASCVRVSCLYCFLPNFSREFREIEGIRQNTGSSRYFIYTRAQFQRTYEMKVFLSKRTAVRYGTGSHRRILFIKCMAMKEYDIN